MGKAPAQLAGLQVDYEYSMEMFHFMKFSFEILLLLKNDNVD